MLRKTLIGLIGLALLTLFVTHWQVEMEYALGMGILQFSGERGITVQGVGTSYSQSFSESRGDIQLYDGQYTITCANGEPFVCVPAMGARGTLCTGAKVVTIRRVETTSVACVPASLG